MHTHQNDYSLQYHKRERCGEDCSEIIDKRGEYSSHLFANESIRVIKEHKERNTEEPLFLYLAFFAVHKPVQVPKSYVDIYKDKKDWPKEKKDYAGYLTAADEALGTVIEALKETDMYKDTLIIYTSDNGALVGKSYTGSNGLLRGGKHTAWEGGVISDGIIGGPARAKLNITGGKFGGLFHAVDWLPTIAQIVHTKPDGKQLHGVKQLLPLQNGSRSERDELFLGYQTAGWFSKSGMQKPDPPPIAAFRKQNWKLVHNFTSEENFLFDLKLDQGEKHNLAEEQPNVTKNMLSLMKDAIKIQYRFRQPLQHDKQCGRFFTIKTAWGDDALHPWCDSTSLNESTFINNTNTTNN